MSTEELQRLVSVFMKFVLYFRVGAFLWFSEGRGVACGSSHSPLIHQCPGEGTAERRTGAGKI